MYTHKHSTIREGGAPFSCFCACENPDVPGFNVTSQHDYVDDVTTGVFVCVCLRCWAGTSPFALFFVFLLFYFMLCLPSFVFAFCTSLLLDCSFACYVSFLIIPCPPLLLPHPVSPHTLRLSSPGTPTRNWDITGWGRNCSSKKRRWRGCTRRRRGTCCWWDLCLWLLCFSDSVHVYFGLRMLVLLLCSLSGLFRR